MFGGLIVNLRNRARGARAERDLRSRVGIASFGDGFDVQGFGIRLALDLVKFAVVGREKRTYGAVSGDARGMGGSINVAGQLLLRLRFRLVPWRPRPVACQKCQACQQCQVCR